MAASGQSKVINIKVPVGQLQGAARRSSGAKAEVPGYWKKGLSEDEAYHLVQVSWSSLDGKEPKCDWE